MVILVSHGLHRFLWMIENKLCTVGIATNARMIFRFAIKIRAFAALKYWRINFYFYLNAFPKPQLLSHTPISAYNLPIQI